MTCNAVWESVHNHCISNPKAPLGPPTRAKSPLHAIDDAPSCTSSMHGDTDTEALSRWEETDDGETAQTIPSPCRQPVIQEIEESDELGRLCPCGDVCTPAEAVVNIESALRKLTDTPFTGRVCQREERLDRSRVYYALGRLKGALSKTRFIPVRGDDEYLEWLATEINTRNCNCDNLLCDDYPCCR